MCRFSIISVSPFKLDVFRQVHAWSFCTTHMKNPLGPILKSSKTRAQNVSYNKNNNCFTALTITLPGKLMPILNSDSLTLLYPFFYYLFCHSKNFTLMPRVIKLTCTAHSFCFLSFAKEVTLFAYVYCDRYGHRTTRL